ncbi:DivIVA domain-containing protein [Corynebacterium kroppenstedtii]|uniref:DivIVA domain-containing protein n=1 Tax=Corynebacterium sp. PCR 32 TaxID=3351342 RepID=UPI003095C8A8
MVYWIVTIVVLVVVSTGLWWVFALLFGRGEGLGPADCVDRREDLQPGADMGPDQLLTMRFSLSFRGYSPREVDMALERAREYMMVVQEDRDRQRRRADRAEERLASGIGGVGDVDRCGGNTSAGDGG